MRFSVVTVVIAALARGGVCLRFFNSTGQLPANMTDECKEALTGDIACTPRLIMPQEVAARLPSNTTELDMYCNDTCTESIKQWTAAVHDCCGNERFDFGSSAILGRQPFQQSASDMADALAWAQGTACLREEGSGNFCAPKLTNGTFEECGDCTLKYLAAMMSSWYGIGRAPSETTFSALLDKCCVDPGTYPHSNWTMPDLPRPTGMRNITCYGGCFHKVVEGDTCESIAYGYNISYDRFLYQNGFDWQCRGLQVGREVCVGSPCSLYKVQENDTCDSIARDKQFTLTELLAWNPTIHRTCDNLSDMKGRTICLSPPGSESYDVNITVSWGQPWTTPSWGSWMPAPTLGDPNGTATTRALELRDKLPTATFVYNATAEKRLAELFARHCPVSQDDFERGFDWYYLSRKCYELLRPYCNPTLDGPAPTGTPSVPDECLPAVVMGWRSSGN